MTSAKKITATLAALFLAAGSLTPAYAAAPSHVIWVLDQIFYETPKESSIAAEVIKAQTMTAFIAVLQNHHIAFERGSKRLDTSLLPRNIYDQIAAVPAGEPFIVPNGDQSVASVIVSHETAPDTAGLTAPDARTSEPPHE